ncbi:hypothetical protein S40288_10697 [Stachybotrys chartarum IBT 40288]|nr:hypothetical protein S40288_10697 [Stachybotrys chartarum IBT 40288]
MKPSFLLASALAVTASCVPLEAGNSGASLVERNNKYDNDKYDNDKGNKWNDKGDKWQDKGKKWSDWAKGIADDWDKKGHEISDYWGKKAHDIADKYSKKGYKGYKDSTYHKRADDEGAEWSDWAQGVADDWSKTGKKIGNYRNDRAKEIADEYAKRDLEDSLGTRAPNNNVE